MNRRATDAYKSTSIEAAPPLKILRMLYAGALRFLEQAQELDPIADSRRFADRVGRADAIVSELRCALDETHAPDLVQKLEQLYAFVESQTTAALLEQRVEPLENARRVLATLQSAWDDLELGSVPGREVA